jgi:hypothetical protein
MTIIKYSDDYKRILNFLSTEGFSGFTSEDLFIKNFLFEGLMR